MCESVMYGLPRISAGWSRSDNLSLRSLSGFPDHPAFVELFTTSTFADQPNPSLPEIAVNQINERLDFRIGSFTYALMSSHSRNAHILRVIQGTCPGLQ